MFRPLTVVAITAFSLVGWHVYRAEEAATQLDRELREISKRIEVARERTLVLRAEWAMLNEPERLRQVVQAHLPLETMTPSQFLRLADLEKRLPTPLAFAGPVSLFGTMPDTALAAAGPAPEHPVGAEAVPEAKAVAAAAAATAVAAMATGRAAAPPAHTAPSQTAEAAPRQPTPARTAEPARAPEPAPRPVAVATRRAEPAPQRAAPVRSEALATPARPVLRESTPRAAVAEARPVARPDGNLLRAAAHLPMGRAMAAPAPAHSALGYAGGGNLAPPVPMARPVPVAPGSWNR